MLLNYDRFSSHNAAHEFVELNLLGPTVWLAGGALRSVIGNEYISDYDLFFGYEMSSETDVESIELVRKPNVLVEEKLIEAGFKVVFKCPVGKLTTLKRGTMKIQLITEQTYGNMRELIDSFDISACRYVTNGKVILTTYSTVRDTLKKHINLHRVDYPVATMKRIAKYIQKGYALNTKAAESLVNEVYEKGRRGEELNRRVYID